jgi:CNT family concentrative nucleoside transporter
MESPRRAFQASILSGGMPEKLISLLGAFVLLGCAWGCSLDRKRFPWRVVLWGLGLQITFAVLILKTPFGAGFFEFAQKAVTKLNEFAMEGAKLVFGSMADTQFLAGQWGAGNAFILAISISAMIILVSSLSSLFYHWGILQRVVRAMAIVMQRTMGTTGSESLAAAANIFMGQTEAPLVIKPYLKGMTRSELLALMTTGMATIAGGVMAVYVTLGASSGHLLTASVMSAPAALMIAKILLPETQPSETALDAPVNTERTSLNSIDALCRGATDGLLLSLNVIAMLIAFVAMVALANFLFSKLLAVFGVSLTLQQAIGYLNAPFAWLMGVPWKDCALIGEMLGERIVLNEFIGYLHLTQVKEQLDPRSFTLATYALCGFANFGSIAIQIGGIGALVPERRVDFAQLGLRAMIGGLLASYLTATIVGILI